MKNIGEITKRLFAGFKISKEKQITSARIQIKCPYLNSTERCEYSGLPCREHELSKCYYYTHYVMKKGGVE